MASKQGLQDDEIIEIQDCCECLGEGSSLGHKTIAYVTLTNHRIIIFKSAIISVMLVTIIPVFVLCLFFFLGVLGGIILSAIVGFIIITIFNTVIKKRAVVSGKILVSVPLEQTVNAEYFNTRMRKAILITLENGAMFRIYPQDKDAWRSALLSKLQK